MSATTDRPAVTDNWPETVGGTATELVAAPPPTPSLFGTTDPVQVVTRATEVADALADVIQRKALFVKVQGKSHVLVEGWQLLGSMLGVTAVCVDTKEVDGGFKATVEARTVDGRVVGRADALCTKHEKRGPWKTADDYARLSMAQTRATSKALKGPLGFVVSLAGYETTPSEEMTFAEQTRPETVAAEPVEPPASTETLNVVRAALKGRKQGQVKLLLVASGVEETDDVKVAVDNLSQPEAERLVTAIEQADGQ